MALHEDYWRWREAYPGEPYWVHFQTTDVHGPNRSVPPFAGLYVSPQRRATFEQWERQLDAAGGDHPYSPAFEQTASTGRPSSIWPAASTTRRWPIRTTSSGA